MIQYSVLGLLLQAQTGLNFRVSWETVILAVIAAIPPSILAFAAYRQAKQVHTVVNSNATIAAQALKDARKEIADLRVYIAERAPATGPLPARTHQPPQSKPNITVDPNDPPDA